MLIEPTAVIEDYADDPMGKVVVPPHAHHGKGTANKEESKQVIEEEEEDSEEEEEEEVIHVKNQRTLLEHNPMQEY